MNKICRTCKKELDPLCFHKDPSAMDGLRSECTDCRRITRRTKSSICQNCGIVFMTVPHALGTYCSNSCTRSAYNRASKGPEIDLRLKQLAWNFINVYVRTHPTIKPTHCPACGKKAEIEAHHEDYNKPNVVRWVCVACHRARHHGTEVNSPEVVL